MAEGSNIPTEAKATVQVTYSSLNPIQVAYPVSVLEEQPFPLVKVEAPSEGYPEEFGEAPVVEVPHLIPERPERPKRPEQVFGQALELINIKGPPLLPVPREPAPPLRVPTKWQEAYNLFLISDETNKRARDAYESGCITFASVQRIYMAGLHQARFSCGQGNLAFCYVQCMLNYGKHYKYIHHSVKY